AQMHPTGELAFAQQQLDAIVSLVPCPYIAQYDWLENALSSIGRGTHLPDSLIHADCHPANALLTLSGQVVLFDWDDAGMGSAVLDVGFLLANCDGKAPWDPLLPGSFHPNEALLQAVIEGYCHYYRLSPEELDYLPDAIRFRSLVFGACQFASAIAQQQRAEFSQWWWRRYSAAEEIAERARVYFEHMLS
ncbi:MAG TPA: phosphotransferase, partial [Ktedonobacteraceae bacterium]|nr:phosphotransferase [Ktedonobacteraceae bacterium]